MSLVSLTVQQLQQLAALESLKAGAPYEGDFERESALELLDGGTASVVAQA